MVHLTKTLRFINNPGFRKFYYGLQGYNKYGLYYDDFYDYTDAAHLEAVRRLPPDLYDQHTYRLVRASQLEITKQFLPKEQWPSYEEDMDKGRFLTPYLDEVMKEKKEKEEWINFLSKD
ncbi:cytochrome b-c1 complex subunit 7 [Dermatophagoides farinae]|uniref:Cytochrome b-c1 complex subunit 7 n=2 Tax=Dermatophagoides farinae TaxID=6954 RepID=QCR7_DERFA|nr:cytochrome b-c1 complex subunit 7 [Dermatophagoides farinae]M9RZ95.1 RecName: Full=Cytochrome b-c1 complex subunit 7; AltName: Full=Allergen Der f 24; AltName: Full=Complex III subunit 7; AltName: Full=Complex III subunit VII; AltName: Full=Ubiquinol-cytochrome c reductase binding protein Der f 24; Short=UQCRB Der f 24; AltName: Full=Ubiquinol-cytochrome c reductase complex 14 kDa protein; AltName: Allergen=Der f 24.0101 [Dermatophagoides farinae]AGI78542.1 ubiquinol-cytochrome c reductase bin